VGELRILLSHLQAPHRLDTPVTRQLLALHRRLPHTLSPTALGVAVAKLLADKIAALDLGPEAPAAARLPHRVLETCFLRGRKNFQAAAELGLSERQVTRERERALRLLAAELAAAPPALALAPEPIPSIEGHIRRDALLRGLSKGVATHRLVGVTGEAGAGKTSLVAALAQALGPGNVWWHRIWPGVNDSLEAIFVELGQVLACEGFSDLRDYLERAGGHVGTASRLALAGLAGRRRLLVVDDFGSAGDPKPIDGFLEEAVARVDQLSVVTIGRAIGSSRVIEVPPLTRAETAAALESRGLAVSTYVSDAVHQLSGGTIGMVTAVAAWWAGQANGMEVLERHLRARGALPNLETLTRFAEREAA
jgi:hypothetical protein